MSEIITKALQFAMQRHKGQKYGEGVFIVHPIQTFQILEALVPTDENLLAAAYLHDCLENTHTSHKELVEQFNKDIADLVLEVTKAGRNIFPLLKTRRGIMLKLADRLSNFSNMGNWSKERQEKYILKTKFWATE